MENAKTSGMYDCWLKYDKNKGEKAQESFKSYCKRIKTPKAYKGILETALEELKIGIESIFEKVSPLEENVLQPHIQLEIEPDTLKTEDSFEISYTDSVLKILGNNSKGVLYGVFKLLFCISAGKSLEESIGVEIPQNKIRMINQWDNISGDIERGYSGKSIFYKDNTFTKDLVRIKDYARLLASVGINSIAINNVNVHAYETQFITVDYLKEIAKFADIFRKYGIKLYLSIHFAAPMEIGNLTTADPLDEDVKSWWKKTVQTIYQYIPDLGGFLVKADSENRPGPFSYGRNHAEGANMLAEALEGFGGIVIWRCFVYNCHLDWRDRSKDRAKAAYENFKPLDGKFKGNVVLQVKNGPMDFQIREPLSPLFGGMKKTNMMMEFQIAQEYTGQQKHLCYLVPMWKEALEFETYAEGQGSKVKNIVDGTLFQRQYSGIAAVSNIGDSECWTGNPLAQANLYGYGRLTWQMDLSSEDIAKEWVALTFGTKEKVLNEIVPMLVSSRKVYEDYTVPLGIGWMVNPNHHYGPSVEGYEYSPWGTYHYADFKGFGVDRTIKTGTGYTAQYGPENSERYENIETCPEELLLFFHNVPYTYKLKTGKTILQHIYDTHFEGYEVVESFKKTWLGLEGYLEKEVFEVVKERFDMQLESAREWRDVINTYFYRKTGIQDEQGRKIYT